jgi:hypothetical protein|tara:strand:- start:374 stop:487 length:114 start_codon:yes stop_codon:yes gene_type:complete
MRREVRRGCPISGVFLLSRSEAPMVLGDERKRGCGER